MQSKATTIAEYLAELPEDRRDGIEAILKVFRKNLDHRFVEQICYGMIGWVVPHEIYPPGYHVNPKLPLMFAALASQKNYYAVYLMCLYADGPMMKKFQADWAKTGKKLDMGKSCIRFKRVEDAALDVLGETLARMSVEDFIKGYERALSQAGKSRRC